MVAPNKKQQECIDNIDGQYLVLAGPGTGKTFTVVRRIQNILSKGVDPSKILCLTFTETAAGEMKKGIDKQLNLVDSDVNVYTYHGFCNEIIKENPKEFYLPENFKLIRKAISREFIKECINEIKPKAYRNDRNDPYYFIDDILKGIASIKQNRLTKDSYLFNLKNNPNWIQKLNSLKNELEEKLSNKKTQVKGLVSNIERLETDIAKAMELWVFYEEYTKKMEKFHYIDFNDMISMVLDKFDNDAGFLSQIANKYEYILVDEYQDTNKSQNDIVFSLTKGSDRKNVFVVGDDDQIIFSFQGARLDTIERFLTEFPETKVICLDENMRSTQSILDIAREIAKQDPNRLEANPKFSQYNITKDLVAKNKDVIAHDKEVRLYKYADALQEYNEIIKEIDELVNSENCPKDKEGNKSLSEIAILTRSNNELETLSELLKAKNIPYELKEGKNIFLIKSVVVMYYYMQMMINPGLHAINILKIMMNKPFSINRNDYQVLFDAHTRNKKDFIEEVQKIKPSEFKEFGLIDNFLKTYEYLRTYATTESLHNTVLEIGSKTGIFNYYLNEETNRCENIAGLKKLLDEADALTEIDQTTGLERFVEYLETCFVEDIEIKTDKAPVKMNAIQLSTYHSSKGKEYEYVYMPTLFNTKWESSSKTNKPDIPLSPSEAKTDAEYKDQKIADCIRIMYVGMTRAKHTLRLSYYTPAGSRTKLTRFISSIQDLFKTEDEPFEYSENSYWNEVTQTLIKKDYDYKKDFHNIIDARLQEKQFSASALNTYLACPRKYLYSYILKLESKTGNPNNASFGSAIHKACEETVNYAIEHGYYPTKEETIKYFKEEADKLPFSSYEQREIHLERGELALDKYYHHLTDTPIKNLKETEAEITCNIEGYDFIGYIDRIDVNDDGSYNIYDYKTGKAKGSSIIGIGKAHEDYYNQIGFYKYMLEQTGKTVKEMAFIFPEFPNDPYPAKISEEECIEIKDKYLNAIKNMKEYKFDACEIKKKDTPPCSYCSFKEFCNLEVV